MTKGLFITVEGIEGVGKTTHIGFIAARLEEAGHRVVQTREPGGTKTGESIRQILLNTGGQSICFEAELLLIFAARAQHISEVIRPAMDEGALVLSDRFTDASYAYQGAGRGISSEKIGALEYWVQGALRPDLTLLLDAPVEVGLARVGKRSLFNTRADRFESEDSAFFERVRQGYLQLAAAEPTRIAVLDATASIAEVQAAIVRCLEQKGLC